MELTPQSIWAKYQKDKDFKKKIDLYEKVKKQENFFIGRQWEGVNAPDLPKPVLNIVKRVTNYLISILVVDDVGIAFRSYKPQEQIVALDGMGNPVVTQPIIEDVLPKEIERINENVKFKTILRKVLRNAAVDGDTAVFCRFDSTKGKDTAEQVKGEIVAEIVDNTNIHFGNSMTADVQSQPYIIISRLEQTKELQKEYPDKTIRADGDDWDFEKSDSEVTTVLNYMWKENGTVHFCQCTETEMLTEPADTGLTMYPVSYFSWEAVKNCYHGVGVVEEVIPNQIEINKLWAMSLLFQRNNAFSTTFIDKTKIEKWDNRVGGVIGVVGNPNEAFASSFKPHDMSSQVIDLVERTISHTKEFMGANDAVLGNVNPQNTSALIQLQKTSAAPLELQRLSFYQFIEDYIRILVDIVRTSYGIRLVTDEDGTRTVDFTQLDFDKDINVDIGTAAYWSETAQIQTMDNLFTKGIITDAKIFVRSIPDKNLPNKNEILQHLEEKEQQAMMQQQMMGGMTNVQMPM